MNNTTRTVALSAITSAIVSLLVFGIVRETPLLSAANTPAITTLRTSDPREQSTVATVKKAEPAVVSVIISKDLPVVERYQESPSTGDPFFDQFFSIPRFRQNGTRLQEIGGGTAFFISSDGLLMTNKHVVADKNAQYAVLLNDGRSLKATVIGRDSANDIALLKVEGSNFPFLKLSQDQTPELGQSVIAIGNALGEFRNTVSVGVISGLQRDITAGSPGRGGIEHLSRILQTDAAINEGNSGGPLLDSNGDVIGMNTAVAAGAQNIGFAIPVQDLARTLESYQQYGRIVRSYIGIRYIAINADIAEEENLPVKEGALVIQGETTADPAVLPGSPADKAGILERDIITAIDGQKLADDLTISDIVGQKFPGETVTLTLLRNGKEQTVKVKLEERKE